MNKIFASIFLFLTLVISPAFAETITINDAVGDAIGIQFETYKIDIKNFTPGINSGAIAFDIYTDYPQNGITVGTWATKPADLFITETYHGVDYEWAIPLVNRTGFTAGTMYAVGSYFNSDHFSPGPGYIYNPGEKVQIATISSNYGIPSLGGGSVTWESIPQGISDYIIHITTGIWQDDPYGVFDVKWVTAYCANDIISGSTSPVPEPATMMLFGLGLLGAARISRKKTA
ncbi:MAG: hypothetical protein US83_C0001G0095 [Candidatus Falkowbacteria bacterium GW2011_GWC2_38_22]|uniref:Ice-binding protein C-terminal domain-containing protein n=1 Tax=Candidatus Falkowbacteria bacterium GW2011_GWE1_38_31 TaxID=1618638 RepID=A0A0G0N1I4_9BACT|nr:MAG: hypothetical protein US73_C0004G0033 [Candidatus Falkowbacteria bacterium GW2011_GWF2_38_1205]KKQ62161.1 MAG: hypothetical protein US83_C0001G0095 [Candidatus Falkowbacteria bacterium GW2011_GWC2_38_22]KKQ64311.1 MAG: hypothetical protein US84_C0001G0095 [Candidatus Falkowbacteria bacterium GW2011_GWF1_38_22]KKQ66288.1 MAG: hypothetical protein US87_C0002G0095 [Candidatus Falkowbacteria bacterium GW2011_GWE2_38_254]KKQ71016.1 MAG: hypothetical protein US91_C0002G0095 [Candidatus Falkowb